MARVTGRGGLPLRAELPDLETSEEEEGQQQDAVPPPVQQPVVPPRPPQIDDPAVDPVVDPAVDPAVVPPGNRRRKNYTYQKGQKEGSRLLVFEGKVYHRDQKNVGPKAYYKCRHRKECGARGYVLEERFYPNLDVPHSPSCPDNINSAKLMQFKEELKKVARTTRQDLKAAYDLALQSADPDAQVLLPFEAVRHAMRRERQKNYPRNIYRPEEVVAFLENSDSPERENYHKTLTIDVDGKPETVLILKSQKLIDLIDPVEVGDYFIDGTFATCPGNFYQVMNVACVIDGVTAVVFSGLMTRRTYPLYVAFLQTIRDDFPQIRPRHAKSDFEAAIMNSVHQVFPEAKVTGCLFHFKKNTEKKMKSPEMGIWGWVKINRQANLLYRKYASLPLLPVGEIPSRLRALRQDLKTNIPRDGRPSFRRFHLYIKRYWILKVRPERLSVFGEEHRTTNKLESVHRSMSRYLSKRGNVIRFINQMETSIWNPTWVRIRQIRAGTGRLRPQSQHQRNRDLLLSDLQNKLVRSQITIEEYHYKVANMYRTWEKKMPPGEDELLADNVEDEIFPEGAVLPEQPVGAADDDNEEDEDGQEFRALPDWPDLDLSDDDLLNEEDAADDMQEMAEAANRRMHQLVEICPVCMGELKEKHMAFCGHSCCLQCWIGAGVKVRDNNPDARPPPKCPICNNMVDRLIKVFEGNLKPRHELMEGEGDFQEWVNRDLNPGGMAAMAENPILPRANGPPVDQARINREPESEDEDNPAANGRGRGRGRGRGQGGRGRVRTRGGGGASSQPTGPAADAGGAGPSGYHWPRRGGRASSQPTQGTAAGQVRVLAASQPQAVTTRGVAGPSGYRGPRRGGGASSQPTPETVAGRGRGGRGRAPRRRGGRIAGMSRRDFLRDNDLSDDEEVGDQRRSFVLDMFAAGSDDEDFL